MVDAVHLNLLDRVPVRTALNPVMQFKQLLQIVVNIHKTAIGAVGDGRRASVAMVLPSSLLLLQNVLQFSATAGWPFCTSITNVVPTQTPRGVATRNGSSTG